TLAFRLSLKTKVKSPKALSITSVSTIRAVRAGSCPVLGRRSYRGLASGGTMRAFRFAGTTIVFVALMASTAPAYAQDAAAAQALRTEIDQLKKDFDARLADLESRLAALGGAPPPGVVAEPVTPIQTPTAPQPTAPVPSGAEG